MIHTDINAVWPLPPTRFSRTLKLMNVHFTRDQEARLARIATETGTVPEELVTNVVARYLDEEARFLAAVEKGIAAANRGEFIEEEEMNARIERMFNRLKQFRRIATRYDKTALSFIGFLCLAAAKLWLPSFVNRP